MNSCAQKQTESDTILSQTEWDTITNSSYSFSYPANWAFDSSGLMSTAFFVMSPSRYKGDDFKENINLVIQDLGGKKIDLDQYTAISLQQAKTLITDFNMTDNERVKSDTLNGHFHQLTYTSTQGIYSLKMQQRWWVKNGKAYVLTFTCEEKSYADYLEIGKKAFNSFMILE